MLVQVHSSMKRLDYSVYSFIQKVIIINNLVTIPFAQFAADLIRTQTIVAEHHGFT